MKKCGNNRDNKNYMSKKEKEVENYEPTFKELCANIPTEQSPICIHDDIEQKIDEYLEVHREF